jgi:phospholipase C
LRKHVRTLAVVGAISSLLLAPLANMAPSVKAAEAAAKTTTPIKHVVVIFQENVSFDHYFGTYPNAVNPAGEPKFTPKPHTPSVNGLTPDLLAKNPNQANPKRLGPAQAMTDDMDHGYSAEQKAFNGGKMDKFMEYTSGSTKDKSLVMDYYDGNTVTGMWNYAQHFAMSDNSYNTVFGPSTPGALNLISGQTHGATAYKNKAKVDSAPGEIVNGTVIGDPDPYYDNFSDPKRDQAALSGKNVGNLMNAKNVTWGWFQGGFRDNNRTHKNIAGADQKDYNPHHQPFQYYQSTSNPQHLPPSSPSMIGLTDQANHQYDLRDFWTAADAGKMPAVSYLKAANYQDGHAGYSDPLDEQHFLVDTINHLQKLPSWKDTAVIISYDDSDGWYDHAMAPIVNHSNDPANDVQNYVGKPDLGSYQDRAGFGPRLPLVVISPYAKSNYVDHTFTDQTSILKFIEDNWKLGRIGDSSFDAQAGTLLNMFDFRKESSNHKLFLDPITGLEVKTPQGGDGENQQGDNQQGEHQGDSHQGNSAMQHVLMLSVDGLHASDLANYVKANPNSNLAALSNHGVTYSNASSSKPSDSFPGLLALITGGTPKSTGVYYDDSYDRSLLPPIASKAGDKPGTEALFDETIDKDLTKIDGGGGINPDALPRDPVTKQPVLPHTFAKVNNVFEVLQSAGQHTAWSDKHLAYDLVNGPSGHGVDDLYTPEIAANNSTDSIAATEANDDLKVTAILNEIDGKNHAGTQAAAVPVLFGMNFQEVSVGQKLPGNGYTDANGTPSSGLSGALDHTDQAIGKMVAELKKNNLFNSTLIIVTAKHGQSPIDPAKLKFVDKSLITDGVPADQIAQLTTDDIGLIWLTDHSNTDSVAAAIENNKDKANIKQIIVNPVVNSRTPDIIVVPNEGVIYTKPGKKIAEHGGFNADDTNVALLLSNPAVNNALVQPDAVQTTQVAPTILMALGMDPNALQAVKMEHTQMLPGLADARR